MYRKIDVKTRIRSFEVNNEVMAYLDKDNQLIFNTKIVEKNYTDSLYKLDSKYLFFNQNKKGYIATYEYEDLSVKSLPLFFALSSIANGKGIAFFNFQEERKTWESGYFDLINNQKISSISVENLSFSLFCQNDNFFFITISRNNIFSIVKNTGKTVWQLDITDLGRYRRNSQSPEEAGKVEKIIGVYNNLLIVTITNSTVLAIDIHTGALKGKWRDLPEGQSYGKSKRTTLVYPFQSFIDQTQGKLIGLIGSYYWEIDLYGDSIHLYDATEEFDKHQVGTQTSGQITPQGEHIFFASEYILPSAQRVQKVAAFNRSTKLIDWSYTFEDLAPMVMPKAPVIEGDRLYILDTGGTLHIFERKEVL
ncbi:MAG: hypothetical protein ACK4TA_01150 [Saprospiraceae bacterium]